MDVKLGPSHAFRTFEKEVLRRIFGARRVRRFSICTPRLILLC
jgi:hypothetical protein